VLVGEEGEVSEVPQGAVVLGKAKTRPEVGRWGLAPRRCSPPRKAVGGRGKRIASWCEESRRGFVLLL
jgi:hypothetical protein